MSATHLDLAWNTQEEQWSLSVSVVEGSRLVRQIAPVKAQQRCPQCQSIIYSRRHRLCSVCTEPLPEQLLFSTEEAARVEHLLHVERNRHRKWMGAR